MGRNTVVGMAIAPESPVEVSLTFVRALISLLLFTTYHLRIHPLHVIVYIFSHN